MANGTLIKVDRNGSKHYEGWVRCDRCSGRGLYATGTVNGQPRITSVDNGVCHKCGGSGKVWSKWIERTPEYEAKLEAQRQARAAKKAAEAEARRLEEYESNCAETLKLHGFNGDRITYLFLGDTYKSREVIKDAGGQWDAVLGWHIDHELEGFQFLQVKYDDVAGFTPWGYIQYKEGIEETLKDSKRKEFDRQNGLKESEFYGTVGDKVTLSVTYNFSAHYEIKSFRGFGTDTMFIHNFRDSIGNQFVWKTSCGLNIPTGASVTVTGAIKEHSEYNGQKQTVLTRCKVIQNK